MAIPQEAMLSTDWALALLKNRDFALNVFVITRLGGTHFPWTTAIGGSDWLKCDEVLL